MEWCREAEEAREGCQALCAEIKAARMRRDEWSCEFMLLCLFWMAGCWVLVAALLHWALSVLLVARPGTQIQSRPNRSLGCESRLRSRPPSSSRRVWTAFLCALGEMSLLHRSAPVGRVSTQQRLSRVNASCLSRL